MRFEFATATRILFGAGTFSEIPALVEAHQGQHVLVVHGQRAAPVAGLCGSLAERGLRTTCFSVAAEPDLDVARAGVAAGQGCDVVVAVGGGSVLDAGKAIAMLLANGGDPLDYIEVVGRGMPITQPSRPFIAVPTTAGTGAEVTRNAVLTAGPVKASLRSPLMLPAVAVVDPSLLLSLPPATLVSGGLDALSQLIEPALSCRANPLSDTLAAEGIRRSTRSLRRSFQRGLDADACEDLALASLYGGLCLANSGLGAVHGFAAPIGGLFHAPHGAVCAALLAPAFAVNLAAVQRRAPQLLGRFQRVAALLTQRDDAPPEAGADALAALVHDLSVPPLSAWGMTAADLPEVVARARQASSMKGNPVVLTDAELLQIARAALSGSAQ